MKTRTVKHIAKSSHERVGFNFTVRRPLPSAGLKQIDPFLMLDHFGPFYQKPNEQGGVSEHPHRGFETVTIMLEGQVEHRDSSGGHGTLKAGDVQWMTAGSGLIHSEMPPDEFRKTGGTVHGIQLWVNLPKRDKMTKPHYQDISAAQIPVVKSEDGKSVVRVIAGEAFGVKGAAETHTKVIALHLMLEPQSRTEIKVPADFSAFAYIMQGQADFENGGMAKESELALFENDGDGVAVKNAGEETLNMLLLAGEPIGEPVVSYGPFVMNSPEEIHQAIEDYQSGRMG
ncbi:MAG: pirin family protein [Rhizobacter sp.]|nr:pirin family protein [Chlorobiales bacterium]